MRAQRLETCGLACDGNRVMSRVCVSGACQLDALVENCATKLFGSANDTGCYQCEERNPARCELQGVNGQWGPWVLSTSADAERGGNPDQHGQCSADGRQWYTHYCDSPPRSCGGIWCYWTTGAPGGPTSELQPEFRCGPP